MKPSNVNLKIICFWLYVLQIFSGFGELVGDLEDGGNSYVPYENLIVGFRLEPNYNSGKVPTLTFLEIMPATKAIASFKLPTTTLARYQVQYFHDHVTVTSAVGLNQSPTVDVIATMTSGVAEVCRKFSTNENTIIVRGLYAVDPLTSAKYRLSNWGKFAALMQHKLKLKSSTLSGEFDTKALDKAPRFRLSLALRP
ncbi:hypothetical protein MKX03_019289 [Papaver bracteatum]|nr:hypothetical protein MKX03_019289 [Papaver bracteatum]